MSTIFKELQVRREETEIRLKILGKDSPTLKDDEKWLDLLRRLDSYITSLVWIRTLNKQILWGFLESGCDYKATAEKYDVSAEWLYGLVDYAGSKCAHRLGRVLEQLRLGNLAKAEDEFCQATGGGDDRFLGVVSERYEPAFHGEVSLSSCAEELDFLCTVYSVTEDLGRQFSTARVEHLLWVLYRGGADVGFAVAHSLFWQCLEGNLEVHDVMDSIERRETARSPRCGGWW